MPVQCFPDHGGDGLRRRTPTASDAQSDHRRRQQQGLFKGGLPPPGDADAHRPRLPRCHAGGQGPRQGKIAFQRYVPLQDGGGNRLGLRQAVDAQPPFRRPGVHGEAPVGVCGRGDHRLRPQGIRQALCQPVGSSDMPGQQRNCEPGRLIHRDHRRVVVFAAHMGRDRPHGNAAGADKHQRVLPPENGAGKICQRTLHRREHPLRQPFGRVQAALRVLQGAGDPPGSVHPPAAEGEDGQPGPAPSGVIHSVSLPPGIRW